jgi:predicted RND superfamily exporter protein
VDEEEEEEEEEGGEEAAGEQDSSTKIRTHEQAHHCISEVMQFAIDSNSSSLLEPLYTVKDRIQKDTKTKKWKQVSLLDLFRKYQLVVYWKRVMCSAIQYFNNVLFLLLVVVVVVVVVVLLLLMDLGEVG